MMVLIDYWKFFGFVCGFMLVFFVVVVSRIVWAISFFNIVLDGFFMN